MKGRSEWAHAGCPVARAADVVGDGWILLIVRDAFDGVTRFGHFLSSLGIARNILADRLRALEAAGIMTASADPDEPQVNHYRLTQKGRDLFGVLVALRQWGEAHQFDAGEPHSTLVEVDGGRLVPRQAVLGTRGKPLQPAATMVRKLPHG